MTWADRPAASPSRTRPSVEMGVVWWWWDPGDLLGAMPKAVEC
jgi:hypothetical protein